MSNVAGARMWIREHRARIVDVSLAAAVLVYGAIDAFGLDLGAIWLAVVAATSAAVLLRRRAPLAVAAFMFLVLGLSLSELAVEDPQDSPGFAFLATLIALFSVGAHTDPPRTYAAPVSFVLFFTVAVLFGAGEATDILFVGLFATGAWAAGFLLRRSRGQTRTLVTQAERFHAEAERHARVAVEEERGRIARELHDAVAHSVSMMVLNAGTVRRRLPEGQEVEQTTLSGVEQSGRQAVIELRRMLGMLRGGEAGNDLTPPPSLSRVEELVDDARTAGVPVELTIEGEVVPLPPGLDLSAYRIVQEALNNVAKHAPGAPTTVRIAYASHQLRLDIVNEDGHDPVEPGEHHGHGLLGMRERVTLFGGELRTGPERSGFGVHVRLPVPAEENGG